MFVLACKNEYRCLWRPGMLELELQASVSFPVWVPRPELSSPERSVRIQPLSCLCSQLFFWGLL